MSQQQELRCRSVDVGGARSELFEIGEPFGQADAAVADPQPDPTAPLADLFPPERRRRARHTTVAHRLAATPLRPMGTQ